MILLDYAMKRNKVMLDEPCNNLIDVEECDEAFEYYGSCNSLQFSFETKCREFCEFCVPDRG